MTKVVAFNGSPSKDENTSILIGYIFKELEGVGLPLPQSEGQGECGLSTRWSTFFSSAGWLSPVGPLSVWAVKSGMSTRTKKEFHGHGMRGKTWHGS